MGKFNSKWLLLQYIAVQYKKVSLNKPENILHTHPPTHTLYTHPSLYRIFHTKYYVSILMV